MKFDPKEVNRMASDLNALLSEVGGPDAVRELDVERFRAQLDGDDEEAARVLARIEAAGEHHAAAAELLRLFGRAMSNGNMPLARGSYAGIRELVRTKLENPDETDENGGEG